MENGHWTLIVNIVFYSVLSLVNVVNINYMGMKVLLRFKYPPSPPRVVYLLPISHKGTSLALFLQSINLLISDRL